MTIETNQVTSYCIKCTRSPGECQYRDNPPIICGICGEHINSCQCDPEHLLRRCYFCSNFKRLWVKRYAEFPFFLFLRNTLDK
jgi:hypothetical protein